MKKLLYLMFLICFIFTCNITPTPVWAKTTYFGRALTTNVYLYSSPIVIDDKSNMIFEIPTTYFVELLNDENELFYKAQYNGIYGYVLKSEVSCINQTPLTPFVSNASFRVFTPSGANLRSSPNESLGASNLITSIPFMSTNMVFYGICKGEEAISYKGNVWYYCKYIKENQEYYGYVYSPLCDLLTQFPQNTESFTYVTPDFSYTEQTNQVVEEYLTLSSPWQIILIIVVSLPCILIIYLLFKPTKIAMQKSSKSSKQKKQ
ncbi:MAG: hypothetical protein J6Q51_04990, partial [Clostridia bacterium]|nr:hypothetical protein [Clostridia bacterium]